MVDLPFFPSSRENNKNSYGGTLPSSRQCGSDRPQSRRDGGGLTSSKLSNWIWAVAASSEHPSLKSPTSWVLLTILAQLHSPYNTPFRNVHFPAIGTIGRQLTTGKWSVMDRRPSSIQSDFRDCPRREDDSHLGRRARTIILPKQDEHGTRVFDTDRAAHFFAPLLRERDWGVGEQPPTCL